MNRGRGRQVVFHDESWVVDELLPDLEAGDKVRILQPEITMKDITAIIANTS